jgi:hypothetical protein
MGLADRQFATCGILKCFLRTFFSLQDYREGFYPPGTWLGGEGGGRTSLRMERAQSFLYRSHCKETEREIERPG